MKQHHWIRAAALTAALSLVGCGSGGEDVRAYSYNNPVGDVAVTVKVRNFGGAAGFVLNEVHVISGGEDITIAKLSHLSTWDVSWTSNDAATLCFLGSVDEGGGVWSQTLSGRVVTVRMDDTCAVLRPLPASR
jgi:hypothetical protein